MPLSRPNLHRSAIYGLMWICSTPLQWICLLVWLLLYVLATSKVIIRMATNLWQCVLMTIWLQIGSFAKAEMTKIKHSNNTQGKWMEVYIIAMSEPCREGYRHVFIFIMLANATRCLLGIYVLATSKVIRPPALWHDTPFSHIVLAVSQPVLAHCPGSEPTSPCPILIMPSTWLESNKYQF